jgi:excisionase family DNA binding protein
VSDFVGFRFSRDAAGGVRRGTDVGEMRSLLSAHDVARTLNVTLRTAQRLLKAGILPAFRLNGGPWRVRREDLEGYIESQLSAQMNEARTRA